MLMVPLWLSFCRGLVNDTYKMDLILVHPPHLIALACMYIASVQKDKENTAWFEELRVDMNVVSQPICVGFKLTIYQPKSVLCHFQYTATHTKCWFVSWFLYLAGEKHCNGDLRFLRQLQTDVRWQQDQCSNEQATMITMWYHQLSLFKFG